MLAESYRGAGDALIEHMLRKMAFDARMDAVAHMERTGELPEAVARKLRNRYEAEQSAGEGTA